MKNILNFANANCRHCYKCIRHCPVKAIKMEENQAQIIEGLCVGCGMCFSICPQNAQQIKSDMSEVKEYLNRGYKVVASLDPTYISEVREDKGRFINALKKMGFMAVEETTTGFLKMKNEYEKYMKESSKEFFISSDCPTVRYIVTKYYTDYVENLIPIKSSFLIHGKYLKEKYGSDVKVVYIGPCISKKYEVTEDENKSFVNKIISFEEILDAIERMGIRLDMIGEEELDTPKMGQYSTYEIENDIIYDTNGKKRIQAHGMKAVMGIFESIDRDELSNVFLDMRACEDGCVGCLGFKEKRGTRSRSLYMNKVFNEEMEDVKDIEEKLLEMDASHEYVSENIDLGYPQEEEIKQVMEDMGKMTVRDELNCGACGYDTCRDKAVAVIRQMAEIEMCMPYMKDRSDDLSNAIFSITPNYIIILGDDFNIIDVNKSMLNVMGLKKRDVIGKYVGEFMDIEDFVNALYENEDVYGKKTHWEKYDKELLGNIIYVKEHKAVVAIYNDVTDEEHQRIMMQEVKLNTIETAQRVIDKQMRVAQEIASLMGETTAETKVILTQLKKLMEKGSDVI